MAAHRYKEIIKNAKNAKTMYKNANAAREGFILISFSSGGSLRLAWLDSCCFSAVALEYWCFFEVGVCVKFSRTTFDYV